MFPVQPVIKCIAVVRRCGKLSELHDLAEFVSVAHRDAFVLVLCVASRLLVREWKRVRLDVIIRVSFNERECVCVG